ncbi:MAG: metallophosphoesterase [Amaricoccus sp.]
MTSFPQIKILHLSDMHFGGKSICRPEDPSGSKAGYPKLHELVLTDLADPGWEDSVWAPHRPTDPGTKLIVAATGDFTQIAAGDEFDEATEFLSAFASAPVLGHSVPKNQIFMVPGNHDVAFRLSDPVHRFKEYSIFYSSFYDGFRPAILPKDVQKFSQIHEIEDASTIIAEINSCYYVEKETEDESRGQIDKAALAALRKQLQSLPDDRARWLKIALVHHHPVLIPSFVEAGRGVDAILDAKSLLRLLRDHGFHMVLHGHKHYPHVFSYDPEPAWGVGKLTAQLVVAGGSCGSTGLPPGMGRANTYNLITLKFNPDSRQTRAEVVTRGLVREGVGEGLDPDEWHWTTLRSYDRVLSSYEHLPLPEPAIHEPLPQEADAMEKARAAEYGRLRGNMPVVEVLPSLMPGQGYEARAWLVQQGSWAERPMEVTWSCGKHFYRQILHENAGPNFTVSFHYWGPMLIQVQMKFETGDPVWAFVYARLPESTKRD